MGEGDGGDNCAVLLCHSSLLSTLTLPKNTGNWSSAVCWGDLQLLHAGTPAISHNTFQSRRCSLWLTKSTSKLSS